MKFRNEASIGNYASQFENKKESFSFLELYQIQTIAIRFFDSGLDVLKDDGIAVVTYPLIFSLDLLSRSLFRFGGRFLPDRAL